MAIERATKKVDNLEKKFNDLEDFLTSHLSQVLATIKTPHEPMQKEHSFDAHIEGESIHHIHFHGDHQSSSHRTPKLDMYKFDGFNSTVWVAQMEQYFLFNNI